MEKKYEAATENRAVNKRLKIHERDSLIVLAKKLLLIADII